MLPNQRNVELMLVSNLAGTDIKLVLDGDPSFTALTAATAAAAGLAKQPVRVVKGTDPTTSGFLASDVIPWNNKLQSVALGAYSAPAEDKWTLAALNTVVSTAYPARELNLRVWPLGLSSIEFQRLKNTGHFYTLSATTSQVTVAMEFAETIDANYTKQRANQSGGLHCYVTSSETADIASADPSADAAGTFSGSNMAFVEGSKTVAFVVTSSDAADAADTVNSALFTSGDYITDGTHVYRVVSVDSTNGYVTINMPAVADATVQTGTGGPPDDTWAVGIGYDQSTLEDGTGSAAAGLIVEATANKFSVGTYNWEKTRLNLTSYGMGTFTYTTMASEGVGTWQQVSEREWFLQGNEGAWARTNAMAPPRTSRSNVDSTSFYDMIYWRFSHDMLETLGQPNNSPKLLSLAMSKTAAGTGTAGATFKTIVDSYILQADQS